MATLQTFLTPIALVLVAPQWVIAGEMSPESVLRESATLWSIKGRDDLARAAWEKLLTARPGDIGAQAGLAMIEARAGQVPQASSKLKQLERIAPTDASVIALSQLLRILGPDKAKLAQVRLMASTGRGADALPMLKSLFPEGLPPGPLLPEYLRILASAPTARQEAMSEWQALVHRYPTEPLFRLRLAQLQLDKPAMRMEALATLEQLVKAGKLKDEALPMWRNGLVALDSLPANVRMYESYLFFDPKDSVVREALEKATRISVEVARKSADPDESALKTGITALEQDDALGARAALDKVSGKLRDDVRWIGAWGRLMLKSGEHSKAASQFLRAAAKDPDNQRKWSSLVETATYWGLRKHVRQALDEGKVERAEALAFEVYKARPEDASSRLLLAEVAEARGRLEEAERQYVAVLKQSPDNRDAWVGRIALALQTGRDAEARDLMTQAIARDASMETDLASARVTLERHEADRLLMAGKTLAARHLLEQTLGLAPRDIWLRYDLARVLQQNEQAQLARETMQGAPAEVIASPQWKYAFALILAGMDEWAEAGNVLAAVPDRDRTPSITRLVRRIAIQSSLQEALLQRTAGRTSAANQLLVQAEADAAGDPESLTDIARAWMRAGEVMQAQSLAKRGLALARPDDAERILDRADLAAVANLVESLGEELKWLAGRSLERAQQNRRHVLEIDWARQTGDTLVATGDVEGAITHYKRLLAVSPDEGVLQSALAEAYESTGAADKALVWVRRRLAAEPDNLDLKLDEVRLLGKTRARPAAIQALHAVRPRIPPDDIAMRLTLVRRMVGLGLDQEAERELALIAQSAPEDARIALQAGQMARSKGQYDAALVHFQQARQTPSAKADAERAMDSISDLTRPYLSSSLQIRNKPGDPGISSIHQIETPLEVRGRWNAGIRWFAQLDPMRLDAGTLPAGNYFATYRYGKYAATLDRASGLQTPTGQRARGTAIGVGIEGDQYRLDAGTTPLGFPVVDLVGGAKFGGDLENGSWSIIAARRPVTSSLLSFAGIRMQDGTVTGGVRQFGLDSRIAKDVGVWSMSASLGVHGYSGRHVEDNHSIETRFAASRPVWQNNSQRIEAGVAISHWRYAQDLSHYTFGQGGYYSPQRYTSLALPVEYSGYSGKWAWDIRGSLSESRTWTKDMPWYPTDAALQASQGNPVFLGGAGGGVGRSLNGMLEFRPWPGWRWGLEGSMDHSADYAPNYVGLYLRVDLDKPVQAPATPEKVVTPYTRY
ncbi:BCSC C-terminal domain-containing protein [Burkholderiaceae bacterium DAT-1]|nr:BCSC C-terminal domain-containing protein [Burkholderiaceae bacterium DAT-1]